MPQFKNNVNPSEQTNDEWLKDYNTVSPTQSKMQSISQPNERRLQDKLFRYLDHRTTRQGNLVLVFESLDGKTKVVKFFNVKIQGRKINYPSGHRGQFNPPEHGDFRKFWMNCVGIPPSRWCRVHKSLRSKLKCLIFTGEYNTANDKDGHPYNKFTEVQLYKKGTN